MAGHSAEYFHFCIVRRRPFLIPNSYIIQAKGGSILNLSFIIEKRGFIIRYLIFPLKIGVYMYSIFANLKKRGPYMRAYPYTFSMGVGGGGGGGGGGAGAGGGGGGGGGGGVGGGWGGGWGGGVVESTSS